MQRIRYQAARIELALNDRSGNRVFLVRSGEYGTDKGMVCSVSCIQHRLSRSAEVVDLLQAMHRRRNAFHSSLELERQKLRIVT
jgi:hypothetical protein